MNASPDFNRPGVFPSQMISEAIKRGWIYSEVGEIPDPSIQPASLDLHLSDIAYRLRCSFLPDNKTVMEKLHRYQMGQIDLRGGGAVLERNRPYLVPLVECLDLPDSIRAKANPKSSTGRLDIFTRAITDRTKTFDEVPAGYKGRLYLEIVPRTFTVQVKAGLSLNQLRLIAGQGSGLSDREIVEIHRRQPLLIRNGSPVNTDQISISNGLFLGLHLGRSRGREIVGFRAKENSQLIDLSKTNHYYPYRFWEEVESERGGLVILDPEKFYLLLSEEMVRVPPEFAVEMTPYDPSSGELRTHYAGFFDPGFGYNLEAGDFKGSRAALEVRAHDVPFAMEHGQNICKLTFDRMLDIPDRLYGHALASNYQGQQSALSKHSKRGRNSRFVQSDLFDLSFQITRGATKPNGVASGMSEGVM